MRKDDDKNTDGLFASLTSAASDTFDKVKSAVVDAERSVEKAVKKVAKKAKKAAKKKKK